MGALISAALAGFGAYLVAPAAMQILSGTASAMAQKQYAEMEAKRRMVAGKIGEPHGKD